MQQSRTINMAMMSVCLVSCAAQDSIYKRFQRFIKEVTFDDAQLAKLLLAIMKIGESERLTLLLDRTNWKFGNTHINILYLAIVHNGIGHIQA